MQSALMRMTRDPLAHFLAIGAAIFGAYGLVADSEPTDDGTRIVVTAGENATTGPRMIVRFFGGWDFAPEDAESRPPADAGYTKGLPMGGDLSAAPEGKAPTFLVAALKDPIGANLDRIQIIKG